MKNIGILIGLLTYVFAVFSQTDTVLSSKNEKQITWRAGFSLAPQTFWKIGDKIPPKVSMPFFGLSSLSFDKVSLTAFYNFSNNSCGAFVGVNAPGSINIYCVGVKNFSVHGGYGGLGVMKPLGSVAMGFIEFGSLWGVGSLQPILFTGVFLPFSLPIKSWKYASE